MGEKKYNKHNFKSKIFHKNEITPDKKKNKQKNKNKNEPKFDEYTCNNSISNSTVNSISISEL